LKDKASPEQRQRLRRGKLLDSTEFGDGRRHYFVTEKGAKLLKELPDDLKDLHLNSPKMSGLTQHVQEQLAALTQLGLRIDEAKLQRLKHRHDLGTYLRRIQEMLPYGVWMMWLKANVRTMSERQVERHMKYSLSTYTSNLKEEQAKWTSVNNNNGNGGGGGGGGKNEKETKTKTKTKTKTEKEKENKNEGTVVIQVRVPEGQAQRWRAIVLIARKHFEVKLDSEAVMQMAEDWQAHLGKKAAKSKDASKDAKSSNAAKSAAGKEASHA
jgi:hypothetical protein